MGKIDKMVDTALAIARDDSHGYSQARRWPIQGTDFDCSSLMYYCANKAGYDVTIGPAGVHYTGSMLADFTKAGFTAVKFDGNLGDLDKGDILLNTTHHTEMYVGNGKFVGAHSSETGGIDGKPGDQTGTEISVVPAYTYWAGWDYVLVPPKETSTPKSKASKVLYGIDVSSNQPKRIVRDVPNGFAIVKMSGNPQGYDWNFTNPYAKQQAADAVAKHGLLGFYHFTYGIQATTEADFFVQQVDKLGYLGKAMLVIDYEGEAVKRGQTWVKQFADRVKKLAGYKPVIYASGSVITSQNLFSLGYPIWCANYSKGYERIDGYITTGCTIYQGCEKAVLWQFTSSGYLDGYDGPLDLDCFYGTKADFKRLMKPTDAASLGCTDGRYLTAVDNVGVRDKRSTNGKLLRKLPKGAKVKLVDHVLNSHGNVWARVSTGGFVLVRKKDGTMRLKKEA